MPAVKASHTAQRVKDFMARILCIDDEPHVVRLKCAILEQAGHEVTPATSAHEAIELMNTNEYDAVVTDWRLGDGNGRAVVQAAKNHSTMPVVVVSGYVAEAYQSAEPLADLYLEKPVNPEELVTIVNELLKASERASQQLDVVQIAECKKRGSSEPRFCLLIEACCRRSPELAGLDRPHGGGAGRGGFGQNPVMDGEQRKFQAVGDTDLVVNIAQVVLNDLLGGAEKSGDFLVLESLHDEGDDLQFLGSKAVTNPGADKIVGVRLLRRRCADPARRPRRALTLRTQRSSSALSTERKIKPEHAGVEVAFGRFVIFGNDHQLDCGFARQGRQPLRCPARKLEA